MSEYWKSDCGGVVLHNGDCLEVLKAMLENSVDAVVTDPPAGISFMGKDWDHHKGGRDEWIAWMRSIASECLRVIKPGGHALVWAIPRTSHWTGMAWELAGWEIRDQALHVFGSGFPKSLNISKMLDKKSNTYVKGVPSPNSRATGASPSGCYSATVQNKSIDEPQSDLAKKWHGWGTALKPAYEIWWLLRKPLSESNVADNVLKWGTGGINIDGCRVEGDMRGGNQYRSAGNGRTHFLGESEAGKSYKVENHPSGRWPANITHDGSDCVVELFPETNAVARTKTDNDKSNEGNSIFMEGRRGPENSYSDSGSASRFFKSLPPGPLMKYCGKATTRDRNEGCEGMEVRQTAGGGGGIGDYCDDVDSASGKYGSEKAPSRNFHPTVKPTELMKYLCRLITPPGGIVLDPFTGSGSTGKGAVKESFNFIGIEREKEYIEIAKARITHAMGIQMEWSRQEPVENEQLRLF